MEQGDNTPHKFKNISGYFDFEYLYTWFAQNFHNGKICEIGAWLGASTCYMCELIKEHNLNIKFYTIDSFLGEPTATDQQKIVEEAGGSIYRAFLLNIARAGVLDYVTPLQLTSEDASELFEDKSLDVVFLDASHLYSEVWNDLENWFPKVKMGGMIAGHDAYDINGKPTEVKQAVNKFFNNQVEFINNCFLVKK